MPDPAELDEQIEVQIGRRAPYSQIGDWVLISCVSDRAVALYCRLAMHINVQRGDTEVWPALDVLAEWAGFSKSESITPYLDELVVIGAVTVEQSRYSNGLRARNRYVIHQTPEPSYVGPLAASEYYALRRARPDDLAAWQGQRRAWIAEQAKEMARLRKEAAKRRPPRKNGQAAPPASGVRTPLQRGTARPGQTPDGGLFPVPRSSGVRTPPRRGPVPRPTGVEQDVVQQDETPLSPRPSRAARKPAAVDPDERENTAPGNDNSSGQAQQAADAWQAARGGRKNPAAHRTVAASAGELLAADWDLADVIALAEDMARTQPAWRDLGRHADHRQPPVPARPVVVLPEWCGECDGPEPARRWTTRADGRVGRCPRCHPHAVRAA
ncbi:hypothetical protein FB465_2114 [Kitasatospora atroaurantiaca]|uniref:Uncharacterized protein n=2 Tax=Kitasatospora atroaurantiaca TaxID=285545 RepID=A0A561ENH0_9ACTN|nr:hypothetical protein FB465_2114 [Kitasatospora atroaurantiaca]